MIDQFNTILSFSFPHTGNVVWLDPHSAARALLGMSRPSQTYNILGPSLEQQNRVQPAEPVPAPSPPPAPRQEPEAEAEPMEEGEGMNMYCR